MKKLKYYPRIIRAQVSQEIHWFLWIREMLPYPNAFEKPK